MQSNIKDMMNGMPTANPFDVKSVMDVQRKNFEAMTNAMQGWQSIAQRQAEMVTQFVQDNATMARSAMDTTASPQDAMTRQAELVKAVCEKTMLNTQEIAEMMRKATVETANIMGSNVKKAAAKDSE
ncbi:MAG: hypothetical protein DI626_12095 [Micavibrio aeruginosavorus]|uniref:Phasin domain-containing protein n=1 Tax=Micavibrio aeruginosavorus TaxID=349221 RepID=A0A2W4Z6Y9_9BACT|nr:MAG: hypothetical protein DI626_12095 [Micavibrio aeruginosavorus]